MVSRVTLVLVWASQGAQGRDDQAGESQPEKDASRQMLYHSHPQAHATTRTTPPQKRKHSASASRQPGLGPTFGSRSSIYPLPQRAELPQPVDRVIRPPLGDNPVPSLPELADPCPEPDPPDPG